MPRKKPEPNAYQQYANELRASYYRDAGRILYGQHDVEKLIPVQDQDAGNLVATKWEIDIVSNPILVKWIDALMAFDNRRDHNAAPLIALLEPVSQRCEGFELLPIVSVWLADLVRRHGIKCDQGERHSLAGALKGFRPSPPTSGRPKGVAYDLPDHIAELHVANEKVSEYLETHGGTVADAIAAVAREKFSDPEAQARYVVTLRNFREGRNTSARRAAKRRI